MTSIEIIDQVIAEDEAELAKLPRTMNGLIPYELAKEEDRLRFSIQAMKKLKERIRGQI